MNNNILRNPAAIVVYWMIIAAFMLVSIWGFSKLLLFTVDYVVPSKLIFTLSFIVATVETFNRAKIVYKGD